MYLQKGESIEILAKWMEGDGLDTLFFSIKRHPMFFSTTLSIAYAFMEEKLFPHLAPSDKSLLWIN